MQNDYDDEELDAAADDVDYADYDDEYPTPPPEEEENVAANSAIDVIMPTEMEGESEESTLLWLQREYGKLLRREAAIIAREHELNRSVSRRHHSQRRTHPRPSWSDQV